MSTTAYSITGKINHIRLVLNPTCTILMCGCTANYNIQEEIVNTILCTGVYLNQLCIKGSG